jgi:phospholipid/cholesterol/gamma-HCH transport system permease protein
MTTRWLEGAYPRPAIRPFYEAIGGLGRGTGRILRFLGGMTVFASRAVVATPLVLRRYKGEVRRQIGELTLGTGFFITFTGTLGVIVIESLFVGIEVGVQGFQGLNVLGVAPLTGFISAYGNTREVAPLIAAVAIAAQIGCKFTAQIGAQRISEEIDALESMAIPSLPYMVTTRIVAAFSVVIPLYLTGLLGSYIATRATVGLFYHQSLGTYDHYFRQFLHPIDVVYSILKVLAFTVFIVVIHTYYGYTAGGGPEGVGTAAARAIRATIVVISTTDIALTMLFWGLHSVRLSGG